MMRAAWLAVLLLVLAPAARADISFNLLAQITGTPERHRGSFEQEKYLAAVDASLRSSGVFDFERGKSIRWEILEPIESELLLTPEGISGRAGDEALLELDAAANPAVAALGEIFFAVLTSDWNTLATRVELSGSIDGGNWHAILVPKDEAAATVFTRLELFGNELLQKIVVHESGGDRTTIRLQSPSR